MGSIDRAGHMSRGHGHQRLDRASQAAAQTGVAEQAQQRCLGSDLNLRQRRWRQSGVVGDLSPEVGEDQFGMLRPRAGHLDHIDP